MADLIEVVICLGSSCFSRKNRDTVSALQNYIEEKKIEGRVKLKGGHCFGDCRKGPIIIVNGEKYFSINPKKAVAILESFL